MLFRSISQHTSAYVSIRISMSERGQYRLQLLRCPYLYCCTSKARKLSTWQLHNHPNRQHRLRTQIRKIARRDGAETLPQQPSHADEAADEPNAAACLVSYLRIYRAAASFGRPQPCNTYILHTSNLSPQTLVAQGLRH